LLYKSLPRSTSISFFSITSFFILGQRKPMLYLKRSGRRFGQIVSSGRRK
jgi:hypothetical protein